MKMTLKRLWPMMALLAVLSLPETMMAAVKCPHDAPKESCFICNPALREKGRLWCKEHGRYEDRCWLCHAELEDKDRAFCTKHFLYVDECFLCKPELKKAKAAHAGENCIAHSAPKELCFICDPALREKGRLWCKEHGRYEDRCWLCHAELEDKDRPFCTKHFLYVDECFLCKPEIKIKPAPVQKSEAPVKLGLFCKEHNMDESDCANCHPDVVATLDVGHGMKVRLPSKESATKVGIQIGTPRVGYMSDAVECYAEIGFNENKRSLIPAPVAGIVKSVAADLGSKVEENAVLATVWSTDIGEAVSKMVLAEKTVERERKLRADRISSEKDFQEAEAAYRMAVQKLKTLGFSDEQLKAITRQPDQATLEIRAPFAGEIIERTAVRGALLEAGTSLFELADLSEMWATLNVPESQLARLRVGQTVELKVDSIPTQTFYGNLTWIAARVDDRTRMAQGRAVIANPDGALRASLFARARIVTAESDSAVVIPQSAVQTHEGKSLVFLKVEDDLYEARCVRVGAKQSGQLEILAGLSADDRVVVAHSFAVKAEMLKARLGAGCCEE